MKDYEVQSEYMARSGFWSILVHFVGVRADPRDSWTQVALVVHTRNADRK